MCRNSNRTKAKRKNEIKCRRSAWNFMKADLIRSPVL